MKKMILICAALTALFSCQDNESLDEYTLDKEKTITVVVNNAIDGQSRVSMGAKNGSVYPMSFDADEHLYLRENSDSTKHFVSSSYMKLNAHTGAFGFKVYKKTATVTYDYVAVYPCHPTQPRTMLKNGVCYGGSDLYSRFSYRLCPDSLQVPTATGPDKSTHLYWATDLGKTTQPDQINLALQPLVAYGKMTLKNFPKLATDEKVRQMKITAPTGKYMSGRFFKYFKAKDSYKYGDVVPYADKAVNNYIKIDLKNITFNETGFDIWFTTFPISLAKDDVLSFEIMTNKNTYSFTRTLSKALPFTEGFVSEFSIDYTKCSVK